MDSNQFIKLCAYGITVCHYTVVMHYGNWPSTTCASRTGEADSSHLTAVVGQPFQLPCSTPLNYAVEWSYQFNETADEQFIFAGGSFVNELEWKFSIDSTNPGEYNLHFRNVTTSDAGRYACVEKNGRKHKYQLEVIGNNTASCFALLFSQLVRNEVAFWWPTAFQQHTHVDAMHVDAFTKRFSFLIGLFTATIL